MPARGSTSTARPCAIGSARRPGCCSRSSTAIRSHVFAAEKIHGDDTTVPVLAPGLGRTKTGRLWVYVRDDRPFCGPAPPAAAYFYSPDRGGEHPAAHLASFTGFLQADGYAGFEALYDAAPRPEPGPITEVACWAHCRRKFFDVWEATKSPVAKEALDRIAAFYAIEAKARFAPAAERLAHRAETAPLLDCVLRRGPKRPCGKLSAKSALAEAFRYTIKRREALIALRHRRPARSRQQHRRERHARHRARAEELSLRRFRHRRRAGRRHLHHRADGEAQRREPGSLSARHARQDRRRASDQPDRRTDAVAIVADQRSAGGRLTIDGIARHTRRLR